MTAGRRMTTHAAQHQVPDVLAIGEVMGLLDAEAVGPLEDVRRFTLRVAGAEGNVLIALTQLGHSTRLVSAVGADPVGRLVLRTLSDVGVDVSRVYVDPDAPTGVFFKERFDDGLRRVYYYRAGSAASRLSLSDAALDALSSRFMVLSGLSLGLGGQSGMAGGARMLLRRLAEEGATVVFDANLRGGIWDGAQASQDFHEIRTYLDVLLAGREEMAALVPGKDPAEAAQALCDDGLQAVIIKDGAQGATVHEHSRATHIQPYPVNEVVDPVGAGDAFTAGVTSGLLQGWSMCDCARVGAVLGALAVTVCGDWEALTEPTDSVTLLHRYTTATKDTWSHHDGN